MVSNFLESDSPSEFGETMNMVSQMKLDDATIADLHLGLRVESHAAIARNALYQQAKRGHIPMTLIDGVEL